jgi:hypothetical protein
LERDEGSAGWLTRRPRKPRLTGPFEREKTIFEQDCQEFRSLNGFLWQIPVIVSTLTGGLWFGASKVCLAIEIDPLFVDLAIRRWQAFTGEDAIRESDGVPFATLDPSQPVESEF